MPSQSPRPQISTLLSSSPILRLPNELLSTIFTFAPDPHSYLTLHGVCRCFYNIGNNPILRRTFTKTWFSSNCNDQPGKAPSLIEYAARYVKRHCILGETGWCYTRYCDTIEEEGELHLTGRQEATKPEQFPIAWYILALDDWTEHLGDQGRGRGWLSQILERMRGGVRADLESGKITSLESWTLEETDLEIEEAVFGEAILRVFWRMEMLNAARKMEDEEGDPLWYHDYLGGMELMKDEMVCLCGTNFMALKK